VRADGSAHAFVEAREIEAVFAEVLEAHAVDGMAGFAASDLEQRATGGAARGLECRWSMTRADGTEIRAWRQTYVFVQVDAGRRIAASILHA